jgi:hypothetical protein
LLIYLSAFQNLAHALNHNLNPRNSEAIKIMIMIKIMNPRIFNCLFSLFPFIDLAHAHNLDQRDSKAIKITITPVTQYGLVIYIIMSKGESSQD